MSLKFTVVTAVFNAEDVIEKTIKSVLNQTYTPYEYLIIDGKSSDKTVEIIRKYSKHFEEKNITLKIVSEKDNGIYKAFLHSGSSNNFYICSCNTGVCGVDRRFRLAR